MISTVSPELKELSIREMVQLLMPAGAERRGRHVSDTDEYPTTMENGIPRGKGKHRAAPVAVAMYLENKEAPARHRARPATLFQLVSADNN